MKRKFAFAGAMLFLCMPAFVACGEPDNTEKPPADTDTTVYTETPSAPAYPEIDDGSYTSYYFDAAGGDDANSGLSPDDAKRSLGAANALIKGVKNSAPAKILFRGGDTFSGELTVSGYSATARTPLVVSSYGEGKAVLDGGGKEQTVQITGGNVRVSGLEIVNRTGRKGVYVYTTGQYENLVIEDCYVHHVNWNWTETESEESYASHMQDLGVAGVSKVDPSFVYETGGIVFFTPAGDTPCRLENVWLKDNVIEKVSKTGVLFSSNWVKQFGIGWGVNNYCDSEHGYYPSRNVNFVGNRMNYTGGDGMVMIGVTDGYIEGNVSYHSNFLGRKGFACAGIWTIGCDNVVVQRNEAAYSHLENGAADGQGFDIDIACTNIVLQYNYSHHNAGGGLLLCNTGTRMQKFDEAGEPVLENGKPVYEDKRGNWEHAVIRNNVFFCNGKGSAPSFANVTGSCRDALFENNTIVFNPEAPKQQFMKVFLWDGTETQYGKADNFVFRNNVFYSAAPNTGKFNFENMGEEYLFVGNVYFNMSEAFTEGANDSRARDYDPEFTFPASPDGYETAKLFVPGNPSLLTGALKLSEKNRYDIAGNDTKGLTYYGAIALND